MLGRKKKKMSGLAKRQAKTGLMFIAPWIIGFIFLFFQPAVQSLIYAFSKVEITPGNMKTTFIAFENFRYAFMVDPEYIQELVNSILNMVYEVPIIILFSMFIAGMLNQKFKGRTAARVLFFLPVIIASGATIEMLKSGGLSTATTGANTIYAMSSGNAIRDVLYNLGISDQIVGYLITVTSKIFEITWKSGIQILLFLSGLQAVPSSYYEVSSMEGATPWEEFWKITFPLLSPTTLVATVYTVVDSFTYYQNGVMKKIDVVYRSLEFGRSAAMSWAYFVIVAIILVLVYMLVFRKTVYIEE